jgi:hypothetical protein
MVGDRISDQYRGIRKIIDEEGVDLVMTDGAFMVFFLCCYLVSLDHLQSPAVRSPHCGMTPLLLS